jgi:hypothetical protein
MPAVGTLSRLSSCSVVPFLRVEILSNLRFQTFCQSRGRWTTPDGTGHVGVDPHFELSMICCALMSILISVPLRSLAPRAVAELRLVRPRSNEGARTFPYL